ncbi:PAS domain S-box protein [Adhaeribacter sp. BT258]|uniref:histidine kinase n=1 Tax=Adhaeribacter terrigena TaxID=2793070 RepID=A0ABS1C2R1_9BACT|nr:PAS domain-containing sensor histidine kinase [Adhaeribacter terrigena]MBK0403462.1 PAS domain S-box protein [Adhaeribacter terrigena]
MTPESDIKNIRFQKMVAEVEDYAILLLDQDGYIESWNKGAEKIKGYNAGEIIGKHFSNFYTPEDRVADLPGKLLAEAAAKGSVHHEGWRLKKDGGKFWGSVTITAIHDENELVIGFSKVTRDLTEKKLAEENLRRSEDRYHKMIAEIQDYAILLMDVNGKIENWNKGAEKIKGYKASEIVGRHFSTFYTPDDQATQKPQRLLEKAIKNGRAQDEGWRVRKNGSHFWANVTITTLHNDDGEITGFSKVTRDLTELKKAQATLLNMQRIEARNDELEQLTYITSHDLQEPLRNISSFIDVFREDYSQKLDDTGTEMLQFIKAATARMSDLINGLLDYGRLGRNSEATEINTQQVVQEICADLNTLIRETGAEIVTQPLPVIVGFRTELRLLLQNLISNAIKFRKPDVKPQVRISAELVQDKWKFAIKDNGIGIESQYLDRIFLIFQRLHTRSQYEGSGIGLAHCKRIAALHHGDLWVTSEPGVGSTFYFTINTNNFSL